MPNTIIRLKDYGSEKTGESQVRVIVQYKSKQYPIAVPDVRINPTHFSPTYGKWLTKTYTNKLGVKRIKTTINNNIESFKNEVHRVLLICNRRAEQDINFKINTSTIKNLLWKSEDEIMGVTPIEVDNYYESDFIQEYKKFIKTYNNENTRKNLNQSVAILEAYQKNEKLKLRIKDFDYHFLNNLVNFLLDFGIRKNGKKDDDYIHSTLHKITFKNLNRFRNYLVDDLDKTIPELKKYRFEDLVEVTELEPLNPQALNKTELDALFYYNFNSEGKINAKKLFFLGFAIGGQRVSDTLQVARKELYLDDSGIVDFDQIKTKHYLENPIFSNYLEPLLTDNKIYPTTEQTLNIHLKSMIKTIIDDKEYMKEAEINHNVKLFNKKVKYTNYKGRKDCRFSIYKRLDEDITFKYARSTFISTLIFDYNKTREEVAMFTGHKDMTIIDFYLKKYDDIKSKIAQEIKPNSKFDLGKEIEKRRIQEEYQKLEELGAFDLDTEEDALDASGILPDEFE